MQVLAARLQAAAEKKLTPPAQGAPRRSVTCDRLRAHPHLAKFPREPHYRSPHRLQANQPDAVLAGDMDGLLDALVGADRQAWLAAE